MSEIWNLSAICRCCHCDGQFKSLKRTYVVNDDVEIYSSMLRDTFGIIIDPPAPTSDISYEICEKCIDDLRRATKFKKQVLICESKFEEYCKNEESFKLAYDVKMEVESICDDTGRDDFDDTKFDDAAEDKNIALDEVEVKHEYKTEFKDGITDIKLEDDTENQNAEMSTDIKRSKTKDDKPKKSTKSRTRSQINDAHSQLILKTGDTYSCRKCGGNFKNTRTLKIHILHKHIGELYKCKICGNKFKRRTDKLLHMVSHDPNHPNICTVCGKIYPTKHAFKNHMNSHTKTSIFECDECKKKFLHKKSLLNHIKLFHLRLPKPLICDICGHSFNDITNMRKHIQAVHEKLRPHKCELCTKDFTAKKHLVDHMRRQHTGEKPYACDICHEAFVCLPDLVKHKARIHEGKITTYTCKQCLKQFTSRGELVKHSRSHSGSKPLICHICNRDFSCKYSLRRHITGHSGEKKFQCSICLKKFLQKVSLNRHIERLHTEKSMVEKEKCHICKKHVRDIQKHIEAHNNKPFGCDFCPKRYPEKNALNRHVANIHFGRKAHACDLCDHRYVHPRSLRNHRLRVHKITIDTELDSKQDGVKIDVSN